MRFFVFLVFFSLMHKFPGFQALLLVVSNPFRFLNFKAFSAPVFFGNILYAGIVR